jgi:hypothetical protein
VTECRTGLLSSPPPFTSSHTTACAKANVYHARNGMHRLFDQVPLPVHRWCKFCWPTSRNVKHTFCVFANFVNDSNYRFIIPLFALINLFFCTE